MARDLDAVLDHHHLSNVVLWGHSIGGMVILTWYTQIASYQATATIKGIILQHTSFTNPLYTIIASGLLRKIQRPVIQPLCYLMIALSPLLWFFKWLGYLSGTLQINTRLL